MCLGLSDSVGGTDKFLVVKNTLPSQEDKNGIYHRKTLVSAKVAFEHSKSDVPGKDDEQACQTKAGLHNTMTILENSISRQYCRNGQQGIKPLESHEKAHQRQDAGQQQENGLFTLYHV